MKKISNWLLVFSGFFYLFFYFVLFDAPDVISGLGFFICLALSAINLTNSVFLLRKRQKQNMPLSLVISSVFTINLIVFLLLTTYVLAACFLPYNLFVG